ncbi:MAG: hypothetical protein Q9N02_10360 [Ghiorsea sp.]|nr:hypothetical protein [Ghiorsea sp.]
MVVIYQWCFLLLLCTSPSLLLADINWSQLQLDDSTWHFDAKDRQTLAAEQLVLHNKSKDGQKVQHINAFLLIHAPFDHIFTMISDFKQLTDYAPHVEHIAILAQNNQHALVDYTLELPLGIKKRYRLQLRFTQNKKSKRMTWHSDTWQSPNPDERIGTTSGYWWLQQTAKPNITLLAYQTITDPGDVPFGLGWVIDYLTHSSIKSLLTQTKIRAEAQWQTKELHIESTPH